MGRQTNQEMASQGSHGIPARDNSGCFVVVVVCASLRIRADGRAIFAGCASTA